MSQKLCPCKDSDPLHSLTACLWLQCHRPFMPDKTFVETPLHGHTYPLSFCCCRPWIHQPVKFFPLDGLLCNYLVLPLDQYLEVRCKALSTCVSHITEVISDFVPCTFVYLHPIATFFIDKAMVVFIEIVRIL